MTEPHTTQHTTECYCEHPTFDPAFEFEDETGFECVRCNSNVWYVTDPNN